MYQLSGTTPSMLQLYKHYYECTSNMVMTGCYDHLSGKLESIRVVILLSARCASFYLGFLYQGLTDDVNCYQVLRGPPLRAAKERHNDLCPIQQAVSITKCIQSNKQKAPV